MSNSRLLLGAVLALANLPAVAAPPTAQRSGIVPAVAISADSHAARALPVCTGCGCRGGAGYRLPSGKCASRR